MASSALLVFAGKWAGFWSHLKVFSLTLLIVDAGKMQIAGPGKARALGIALYLFGESLCGLPCMEASV